VAEGNQLSIPCFSAKDSIDELSAALDAAGCLVVTDAADESTCASVVRELAAHMDVAPLAMDDDPESFYPGNTRRVTALAARSRTVGELILHETPTGLCDRFLTPNAEFGYQLHVTAALEVGPGAREQILHREEDTFTYFELPRPNIILASMWAISDFRAENGATLIVPGSHRWPADRVAEPHEIVRAEMPAGSILFWAGGTLHGAGANTSDEWRYGVILTYSLGWVRQEENQYLDVTPQVAEQLSPELRKMIGYDMHRALGFYDPRVKAGTVDQAADVYRVPAANYYEPERWRLEMERIFKRLPLTLGFSCELREPGSYRAMVVADTPVLLTRAKDGAIRAFLNVCSHRGGRVVTEGTGSATRFTCPYHAWSYDNQGTLLGIYNSNDFGDVDKSCLGLTPLPVAERAGLIFASLTPGDSLDIDTFLCGYDELLAHHRFDEYHLVGRQEVEGPNWKVAYDGYLDFYHLPILHRETFGSGMSSDALYDAWGPHQRVNMPNPGYDALESLPEEDWKTEQLISGVWTIFPHVSVADFDAGQKLYMVSQLFPGATPDESVTVQNFLAPTEPDEDGQKAIDGVMGFLLHVVRDEDYYTGNRIQQNVKTGAKSEFLFGRNEGGGQRFHRWVEELIHTEDAQLPKLFEKGLG
jgi:phenylpropionate dioxygenase-like ring-hydroxylating dioxygenase large terminal subunit/ectoine hydroxylase-related dioxygenase (phytanoyl-CoA dioxygenase family)